MAELSNVLAVVDAATGLVRTLAGDEDLFQDVNLRIGGNLIVEGTTTTTESEQVLINDNYLYLNNGYTTAAAQTGGFVVNRLPTATVDTVDTGGFTAGVAATSNPTVATTGAATFSVGDIIQISGANDSSNNGLFEVLSHAANVLTIRGVGTTAAVEDFTDNQFVTDTVTAGSITKVNVAVMRADSAGTAFEVGFGSSTPISFAALTDASTVTLQVAYDNGATITTSGGTPITFAGTEKLQITASGGLDIDTSFDFDGTAFDVNVTGGNGFSIDGTAASNISVAGGDLSVSTASTGSVLVDGVDGVEINSTGGALNIGNDADAQAINIGTGAAARTVTLGNATGATALIINSGTGGVEFNMIANQADVWKVDDGSIDYITIDTTTGKESVDMGAWVDFEATAGVTLTAGAALVLGNVLVIDASGEAQLADANAGTTEEAWAVGTCVDASVTATNPARVASVPGTLVPVKFAAAPAAGNNGDIVYVSDVAGEGTLTAPVGAGRTIFVLGILQGADGVSTTPDVLFQPQFSAKRP